MLFHQTLPSSTLFVNLSLDTEGLPIAVLYSGLLRCNKVDLPLTTTSEALCTRFKVSCSAWLLLTIYRPGSNRPSSTFFDELATVLETLVTHGCPVVIGGDINIHVENLSDVNGMVWYTRV